MTMDSYLFDEGNKLPNLNTHEFSHKLNTLLDKVSIQNRYASRISHANVHYF